MIYSINPISQTNIEALRQSIGGWMAGGFEWYHTHSTLMAP